jgi:hypothetical protein
VEVEVSDLLGLEIALIVEMGIALGGAKLLPNKHTTNDCDQRCEKDS